MLAVTSEKTRYELNMQKHIVYTIIFLVFNLSCFNQTSDEFLKQGLLNYENKEYNLSLESFDKALQLDPNKPVPFFCRVRAKSALKIMMTL